MKVLSCAQMRLLEQQSDAQGTSYRVMMEGAAAAAAGWILQNVRPRRCAVLCGRGNNGGDGYAVARLLHGAGVPVSVALPLGEPKSELAALQRTLAQQAGVPETDGGVPGILAADLVVDALFGTGFHGALPDSLHPLADALKGHPRVVALDLPSGLDADSPAVSGQVIRAAQTLCFEAAKPACLMLPAAEICGALTVLPIGIPKAAWQEIGPSGFTLDAAQALSLLPPRADTAHKGDFGRLLCWCGSESYPGAAVLSAMAALRGGAGVVTVASVPPALAAVAAALPEATQLRLKPTPTGQAARANLRLLAERAQQADVLLMGCGLGRGEDVSQLVRGLLPEAGGKLVLDADGLNAFEGRPEALSQAKQPPVVTPHIGEMARLTGQTAGEIKESAPQIACEFARRHNAVVVLKDASTVVASPDGRLLYHRGGNPGLSRGGSGDVLAGLIAALAAQGLSPFEAACAGVTLHGAAGARCAARRSKMGMLPHELLDDLCEIYLECGR